MVLTDIVGVKKRGYYQSINYVNFGTGSAYVPLTLRLLQSQSRRRLSISSLLVALAPLLGGQLLSDSAGVGYTWLFCPKFHLVMRLKADQIWYTIQIQLPFCIITLIMVYLFVPSNTENMSAEKTSFRLTLRQLLQTFDLKGASFLVSSPTAVFAFTVNS